MRCCDDERYQARPYISVVNVAFNHFAPDTLSSNVPNLHGNSNVTRQLQPLDKEIKAKGLLVVLAERVTREAHGKGGFPHSTIAQ